MAEVIIHCQSSLQKNMRIGYRHELSAANWESNCLLNNPKGKHAFTLDLMALI